MSIGDAPDPMTGAELARLARAQCDEQRRIADELSAIRVLLVAQAGALARIAETIAAWDAAGLPSGRATE